MKRLNTMFLAALIYAALAFTCTAQLSVETGAAIRYKGITDGEDYGASATVGYDFNKYVKGFVRAVAYSNDDWGGSAIDEGSLGIEATFLRSANGKVTLSAIGAVSRDFVAGDWGIGLGLKPRFSLTKNLYLYGAAEYRVWDKQDKDLLVTCGLGFAF